MSDPRNTDPRYSDPRFSDPVLRNGEFTAGPWAWVAGIAVLALIAFVLIAGSGDKGSNTASTGTAPITSGNAPMRNLSPPSSTTGSGATSPRPLSPPTKSGTQ